MKMIVVIVFAVMGFIIYQYRSFLVMETVTIANNFPIHIPPNMDLKRCKGFAKGAPIETLIEFKLYTGDGKQGDYYYSIERDCILFLKNEHN